MEAHKIYIKVLQGFEKISDALIRYRSHVMIGIITVIVLSVFLFVYRTWTRYRNESAQKDLAVLVESYNKALLDPQIDLDAMSKQFHEGYEKNISAHAAPYFLVYQTDILLRQNKEDEALALLDTAISRLSTSPLTPLYKMQRALIKLDSITTTTQKDGLAELDTLAYDEKNQFSDSALFYLGRYYWSKDDVNSARKAWQTLCDAQVGVLEPSPWAALVKQYLSVTIV